MHGCRTFQDLPLHCQHFYISSMFSLRDFHWIKIWTARLMTLVTPTSFNEWWQRLFKEPFCSRDQLLKEPLHMHVTLPLVQWMNPLGGNTVDTWHISPYILGWRTWQKVFLGSLFLTVLFALLRKSITHYIMMHFLFDIWVRHAARSKVQLSALFLVFYLFHWRN